MNYNITLETKLQRNDTNFLSTMLGEEVVMMNLETGDYLGINNVGSDIWNQLETPKKIEDIITYLTNQYQVSFEQCQAETLSYISELMEHKIVQVQS